jgi:hypothetical protein
VSRLQALALLTLALAPAGCRKSMAPGCRIVCTCSPCTDNDLDSCLDKAEKAQDDAVAKGCTEAFDTFVGCFEDNARCKGTSIISIDDHCTRAASNLRLCADAGNPFASVCEEAQNKLVMCIPGQMAGPTGDCTGQAACTSECVLAAPCETLTGQKFDQTFNDCMNACSGVINGGPPVP